MNPKYKSKEFVLTLFISSFLLVLLYALISMAIEGYNLSTLNLTDYDSLEELDYIYLIMFYIFCLIVYELLMLGWSLILLKEYNLKGRSKLTFYLLLINSSLPILLLIYIYSNL